MAERRMFSKRIINTAKFLKMPLSTQALYFHLGLNADDDGIVEAFTVMRTIGATEDDLRILIAKDLITVLNEDLVAYIMDWTENNKLRADRKVDSLYQNLLLEMVPDANLIEAKVRADRKLSSGTSQGQPKDGVGKDRIGKVSIGKVSSIKAPTLEEVQAYCKERGNGVDAQKFYDYYSETGWKSSDGKPVKNWKGKMIAVWEGKVTTSLLKKQICNDANEMSTYASKNGGIDFDVL